MIKMKQQNLFIIIGIIIAIVLFVSLYEFPTNVTRGVGGVGHDVDDDGDIDVQDVRKVYQNIGGTDSKYDMDDDGDIDVQDVRSVYQNIGEDPPIVGETIVEFITEVIWNN